jgi:hypothetical protein
MPDFAIFVEELGIFIIWCKAAVTIDIGRVDPKPVIFKPEIADLLTVFIILNILFISEALAADETAAGDYLFHVFTFSGYMLCQVTAFGL